MSRSLEFAIEEHFAERGVSIRANFEPVSGSSLHEVGSVSLTEIGQGSKVDSAVPERLFVKFGGRGDQEEQGLRFAAEAAGLRALAAGAELANSSPAAALRVPSHVWVGHCDDGPYLSMEAVVQGSIGGGFFSSFGESLAALHRSSQNERCGFGEDNFLGLTAQPNGWKGDWVSFFRQHRLQHLLRLNRSAGRSTPELDRLGDRLSARLGEWLDLAEEPACLLHGDLWGGNFLVGSRGEAVLIDPAVHYGHRECDLAMAHLFGGFSEGFFRAYEETWPLPPGSDERIEIYQLYHRLNHLLLFGSGYLSGCLNTLRRFVG